jgi:hypothetical protein
MAQTDRNAALVAGAAILNPCRVATTANITLSGEQTIDGVAVVDGDRVLVKDQTDDTENGIYEADTSTWSRTKDCNGAYDLVTGSLVYVRAGTAGLGWYNCTSADTITIGTDSITWSQPAPSAGNQTQGAVLDDLNTTGANAADSEFLVGTGAGALAWESGATAVASLGILALAQSWTAAQRSTYVQLTDAATVAVDFADGNNFYVTITASRTIGQPSNQTDGQSGIIVVEQDGTGGWTPSWHADWDWGAAGAPVVDTSANKKAVIAYEVDWDTTIIAKFVGDF